MVRAAIMACASSLKLPSLIVKRRSVGGFIVGTGARVGLVGSGGMVTRYVATGFLVTLLVGVGFFVTLKVGVRTVAVVGGTVGVTVGVAKA